jgi:hypothetical protein
METLIANVVQFLGEWAPELANGVEVALQKPRVILVSFGGLGPRE